MSKTVDERVVSMQFDNRHFENNVQTTLSTLDKLKQKLNLSNTAKGLESLGDASKKVNLNPLAQSVEAVQMKFSALQVVGITTLQNLTNSAVNAGKKMVSALTIDPVKTGFSEYETKINSIQTIMSNTASKGTTMADVTRVIDELNTYADKTIYNFAEMTRNIGTFTAAGVGLQESADAIQGIANLAAASGSTSQQASSAMYQLSQALAAGTVKLMDWNSVVTNGMGGEKFQEALKATAREMGIGVDAIIEKNGSFRESLQDGWITADVLNTTLQKFTKKGAKEYADAMLKSGKYTQEQADALMKEAQSMEDAATKVKTFTQLIDTLKESLQSGWGKTWEILIGDFEEAKELFTSISDFLGGFINKISDARNNILEGAMASPFGKLAEKIDSVTTATKKVTDATKDYNDIVNKVIQGEFGNGQARWDKLTEAGYDWAHVQNLVNERLGDSTRHATNYAEAQNGANDAQVETIEQLIKMSDAQLKNIGFTNDEIEAFRELEKQSKKTGIPIKDLLKDTELLSGRSLLINSFKNAGSGLLKVFESLRDAWVEIFPPKSTEERAAQLYDLISALHGFSTKLKMSEETADKLKRTFKGVFALIDILTTILGGGFKIAFKVVSSILGYFNLDLLSLTAIIGDALVGFRDWFDSLFDLSKILDNIVPWIKSAASAMGEWFEALRNTRGFENFMSLLKGAAGSVKDWFDGLREADNIPKYIIEGFINGLTSGIKTIGDLVFKIGKIILEKIREVLGIQSPSTEFFEIAKYCILGFVKGFGSTVSLVWETIGAFAKNILTFIQQIDIGQLISVIFSTSALVLINKFADTLASFAKTFSSIGSVFGEFAGVLKGFSKVLGGFSQNLKARAFKEIAIGLAILAGAIVVLTLFYDDDMLKAVGILAVLAVIIGTLSIAINKLGATSTGLQLKGVGSTLLALSVSLLLLAATVKILSSLDPEQAAAGFAGLFKLLLGIIAVIGVYGLAVKGKGAQNMKSFGKMIRSLAITLLLLVAVVKLIGLLKPEEMIKGGIFAGAFLAFLAIIQTIGMIPNKGINKLGGMMLKLAGSMVLLMIVCKLAGKLNKEDAIKGGIFAGAFLAFLAIIQTIGMIPSRGIDKVGGLLFGLSAAMIMMGLTVKILGSMKWENLAKGLIGVYAFASIIMALMVVAKVCGPDAPKLAGTILAVSVAIGILAGISLLLSLVDPKKLRQGVIAVGILAGLMTAMIWATRGASECKGNITAMAVAIALMAVAVGALSFIDPDKLSGATVCLISLMGMFAILIKVSGQAAGSLSTLIMMTIAIGLLGTILIILANMPIAGTIAAAASLGGLMLIMVTVLVILGSAESVIAKAKKGVVGLLLLSISLAVLVAALIALQNVNNVLQSAISLSLLVTAMTGVLIILGAVEPMVGKAIKGALGIAILSSSLFVLVAALSMMSGIDHVVSSAIALGILLGVMTGTMVMLSMLHLYLKKALVGVAGMILLAGSLVVLATALKIMGGMSWKEMAVSLITLAGAFIIIGVAGAALGFLSPVILALSAAFLMIGIGTVAAGIGLQMIAVGITALAMALSSGATTIIEGMNVILTGMITLVPLAIQVIGVAITSFCAMIIQVAPMIALAITTVLVTIVTMITTFAPTLLASIATVITLITTIIVPKIIELAVTLITGFLNAIITLIPKITETAIAIITAFLTAIVTLTPKIVDTGMKVLLAILKGIADHIADIVKMAVKIITEFIRGIAESLPSIIQAGVDLILSFINGMADAIRNNNQDLITAVNNLMDAVITAIAEWFENFVEKGKELVGKIGSGIGEKVEDLKSAIGELIESAIEKIGDFFEDFKEVGKDLIDGFTKGIKEKINDVGEAVTSIGEKAANGLKEFLGINSPSKLFAEFGVYSAQGLIKGLESYEGKVASTTESMGATALDAMRKNLSNLGSVIGSDIDSQPTIRPVLDLSDVSSGVGLMNDMFDMSPSVGVLSNIRSISSSMNSRNQNGGNDSVISAIKDLKDSISMSSGNTYSINGVTYDDGSNVADAVQSLIRAAKIERRM